MTATVSGATGCSEQHPAAPNLGVAQRLLAVVRRAHRHDRLVDQRDLVTEDRRIAHAAAQRVALDRYAVAHAPQQLR